ncbi:MurR/RpiR family transcriptional regulator [Cerasibacillus sp. JNUCC 74]
MNIMDFLARVKSIYPSLTKSEKKVASFVSENYQRIAFLSLTEFADEFGVGEATVIRFLKKVGFSGYHEFKTTMAKQLLDAKEVKTNTEFEKTYHDIVKMLDETRLLTNAEKIKQSANLIKNSKAIYLFGIGFSALAAQGAQIRLMRLGYKAYFFSEQHTRVVSSHLIESDDLSIAFSVTGDTRETLQWLSKVKENGAKTIAITNHSRSPITKIAELILFTAGKEVAQEGSTLITEMSQLFVVEQICHYLHEIDGARIALAKKQISESID